MSNAAYLTPNPPAARPGASGHGDAISEVSTEATARIRPKAVIIGAGLMGRWHLYFARRAGAQVVAVVDPDRGAADALAARAPGARALTGLESLLDDDPPYAAHICTPTHRHFDLASTLVAAGVHVLIEKPLCQTPEEAHSLTALAREKGVMVCPVHQYAFQHGVERALEWATELGRVRRISFEICSAGADRAQPRPRMDVIDEILPHALSLTQRLAPAAQLAKLAWSADARPDGEYFASAWTDGAIITIAISLNARPTRFLTRIDADRGAIEIDGFHGFATRSRGGASRLGKLTGPFSRSSDTLGKAAFNLARRAVLREPAYPGLLDLIRQFYASARGASAPPISHAQIIENVEAWNKMRVSRLPVALPP